MTINLTRSRTVRIKDETFNDLKLYQLPKVINPLMTTEKLTNALSMLKARKLKARRVHQYPMFANPNLIFKESEDGKGIFGITDGEIGGLIDNVHRPIITGGIVEDKFVHASEGSQSQSQKRGKLNDHFLPELSSKSRRMPTIKDLEMIPKKDLSNESFFSSDEDELLEKVRLKPSNPNESGQKTLSKIEKQSDIPTKRPAPIISILDLNNIMEKIEAESNRKIIIDASMKSEKHSLPIKRENLPLSRNQGSKSTINERTSALNREDLRLPSIDSKKGYISSSNYQKDDSTKLLEMPDKKSGVLFYQYMKKKIASKRRTQSMEEAEINGYHSSVQQARKDMLRPVIRGFDNIILDLQIKPSTLVRDEINRKNS